MKRLPVLALLAISLSVFTIAMVVHKWTGIGLRSTSTGPRTVLLEDSHGPVDPPKMTPEEEAEFVRETVRRLREEIDQTRREIRRYEHAGKIGEQIPPPKSFDRLSSAAEVAMRSVGEKALKEIDGCVRIEFINVSEGNSLAHQNDRTYSGVGYVYDKDDKPIGTTVHWHARVIRKDSRWEVDADSVDVQVPKPVPIKRD